MINNRNTARIVNMFLRLFPGGENVLRTISA